MTENIIFLQQVRDASNTTLDVLLANISSQANLGANAANTVTVSANNGSVRIANSINFVNSANLKVFVSAGGTGNANVTFDIGVPVAGQPQGSNTHIQYNNNGAFGGTANLTYNAATNNTSVNGIFNLNGVNVQSQLNAMYTRANLFAVVANGGVIVANAGNVNFNNTGTINVTVTANGTQANVQFDVNTSSVQSGSGTITDFNALSTANQTVFTLTANASSAAYVIITRNGVLQVPGVHYTISANGGGYLNQLTFTSNTELNDVVDARIFSTSIAQSVIGTPGGANTWVQYNDSGVLGASTNFTFNKANNALTVSGGGGAIIIGSTDVLSNIQAAYAEANSAANTVSIQANSASTQPARKLNFVNTASTLVRLSDQGNGTANVGFDAQVLLIASLSDLITPLTVKNGAGYLRSPKTFTLTDIRLSLANISGSGAVPGGTVSVGARNLGALNPASTANGNLQTMTGGTQLLVANGTQTNANIHGGCLTTLGWGGAANGTQPAVDTTGGHNLITDGDMIVFDIVAAGVGAQGLTVYLIGQG